MSNYIPNNTFSDLYSFIIYHITITIYIIVDIIIKAIFITFILPALVSLNIIEKFKNGIIEYSVVVGIPTINAIIPGNIAKNVNGVKALCASLNVFDILAIAIDNPLINKEYIIIIMIEIIIVGILIVTGMLSYILYVLFINWNEINARTKLNTPVTIDDVVTPSSLPIIISLLLIGNVSNVSRVPLSFSPAGNAAWAPHQ